MWTRRHGGPGRPPSGGAGGDDRRDGVVFLLVDRELVLRLHVKPGRDVGAAVLVGEQAGRVVVALASVAGRGDGDQPLQVVGVGVALVGRPAARALAPAVDDRAGAGDLRERDHVVDVQLLRVGDGDAVVRADPLAGRGGTVRADDHV